MCANHSCHSHSSIELRHLRLDQKFFDKGAFKDIHVKLGDASALPGSSDAKASTKQSSIDEVRQLRAACRDPLELAAHVLTDSMARPRAACLCILSEVCHAWYSSQATHLRSAEAGRAWILGQASGDIWHHMQDSWALLREPSKLDSIGLLVSAEHMTGLDLAHAQSSEQEEIAKLCGKFVSSLVLRRSRRTMWMWGGWPTGLVLLSHHVEAIRLGTLSRLRSQWDAFQEARDRGSKFWLAVCERCPLAHLSVQQFVLPLQESGWVLSQPVQELAKKISLGPWQSRLVEDGFLRQRRAEHKAANLQLSDAAIWNVLISKEILEKRYRYATIDYSSPSRMCEFPERACHASVDRSSIPLKGIKGYIAKPPWPSHSPESQVRCFAELVLMEKCMAEDSWDTAAEKTWIASLFPESEPVIFRESATHVWQLVLGTLCGRSVLLWPLQQVAHRDGSVVYMPSREGKAEIAFPWSLDSELRLCQWASPLRQKLDNWADAAAAMRRANISLVTVGEAGSIPKIAARECFWGAQKATLHALADALGVPGVSKATDENSLVQALVEHLHPDLDPEELYAILLKRAPFEELYEGVIDSEDFLDFLDACDRPDMVKKRTAFTRRQQDKVRYYARLRPLRQRIQEKVTAEVERDYGEKGSRGPAKTPVGEWTQALANTWVPPGCHVHLDRSNGRWRVRYPPNGQLSRSFALHGFEHSLVMCLRAAWSSFYYHKGVRCPLAGVFSSDDVYDHIVPLAADETAAPVPGADAAPAPKGRGRGRGKGKAKPKAKGKAKVAPAPAAAPIADESASGSSSGDSPESESSSTSVSDSSES